MEEPKAQMLQCHWLYVAEPGPVLKVAVPQAGSQEGKGGAQKQGGEGRGTARGHLQPGGTVGGMGPAAPFI